MSIHRKIYEQYHGPIPQDHDGRTFDIHHIDGNKENNDPSNLVAVSIHQHLEIHRAQGDHKAVLAIMLRLHMTPQEISDAARKAALQRIEDGTHHWVGGHHQRALAKKLKHEGRLYVDTEKHRDNMREINRTRLSMGQHNFTSAEHRELISKVNQRRIDDGSHPFLNGIGGESSRSRIADGTHHFLDSDKQRMLSNKAKLKNSYIILRTDTDGNEVQFVGIIEAINATPGSTYKRIQRACQTKANYLGYTWINLGKGFRS